MIRWAGMEILEEFKEVVDPRHTALLLWNFSPRVIDGCFNRGTMLAKTKTLVDKARARGVRLIYSKPGAVDWNIVGAPMLRMRMKQMRVKHPSDLPKLQAETAFVQGLEPAVDDIIFEQFLPNAFLGSSFEWWLRKYQLKTLIVTGASLETGIDGTACAQSRLLHRDCARLRRQSIQGHLRCGPSVLGENFRCCRFGGNPAPVVNLDRHDCVRV